MRYVARSCHDLDLEFYAGTVMFDSGQSGASYLWGIVQAFIPEGKDMFEQRSPHWGATFTAD